MTHPNLQRRRCASLLLSLVGALVASTSVEAREIIQGTTDPGIRLGSAVGPPTQVCIDTTSSLAWTLLYSTRDPDCADAAMRQVRLADFPTATTRQMLSSRVTRQTFPDHDVLGEIRAYLMRFPRQPVGLTWDGGMAITAGDYAAAERRHAAATDSR